MDREQEEMQFLGLFDIIKESFKIIYSWRSIFSKIAVTLILPLSFIFLLHIAISDILMAKILSNELALDDTFNTPRYEKLSDILSKEWTVYMAFKFIYFTFFLVLSLLSTAAVVYTIACIYTSREVTFWKVLRVVPGVWKRLMATFLCIFGATFLYNTVSITVFVVLVLLIGDNAICLAILFVLGCIYLVGLMYMSIIWQLASVVSVLEEFYGVSAMIKSKDLIKGKEGLVIVTFFMLNFLLGSIQSAFQRAVMYGTVGMFGRIMSAVLFFISLSALFLFGLTVHTVIYLVCKSYHHENIDKSALSDHLEVYLGEYVPLKSRDIQLNSFEI